MEENTEQCTVDELFAVFYIGGGHGQHHMYTILSPSSGIVNVLITQSCGGEPVNFMAKPEWFRPIYVFLQIWQTFGYTAIIYIAAITDRSGAL